MISFYFVLWTIYLIGAAAMAVYLSVTLIAGRVFSIGGRGSSLSSEVWKVAVLSLLWFITLPWMIVGKKVLSLIFQRYG